MAKRDRKKSSSPITAGDCGRYWRYIEKIAFSPGGTGKGGKKKKDVDAWLRRFIIHFQRLYERTDSWPKPERKENGEHFYKIDLGTGAVMECKPIIDRSNFRIDIRLEEILIQFHYDSRYACECDDAAKYENNFDEEILKELLERKVDHPALHYHFESPHIQGKYSHEIRIGADIKNPFFFLYQLAYQFLCFPEDKRRDELKRLKKVIFENRDKDRISPGTLFGNA